MRKASVVPEGRYTLPSSGALSGMCAGLMRFSTTPFRATVLPRVSSYSGGPERTSADQLGQSAMLLFYHRFLALGRHLFF